MQVVVTAMSRLRICNASIQMKQGRVDQALNDQFMRPEHSHTTKLVQVQVCLG